MAIFDKLNKEDAETVRQWDILINKIIDGDVIPVIGPEILVDEDKGHNPHQILIDDLSKEYGVTSNPTSFSQLLFDNKFDADDRKYISIMLGKVFEKPLFTPSKLLKRLLSIRQFPFVITTSFTPVVEDAMVDIWGKENLQVMNFCNNPGKNSDLKNEEAISLPTVYYMFGKVSYTDHSYVITDSDMLSFCKAWLSDDERSRPKKLANALQSKYLLFLGNSYSDWLCRFVLYSMKSTLDSQPTSNKTSPVGMMVDSMAQEGLLHFLKCIDAFTQTNPEMVMDEIEERLAQRMKEEEKTKFSKPQRGTDVFLSYSRSDLEVTEQLYEALTKYGLKVWYDRDSLGYGAAFMKEIKSGIRTTKLFVPIMTHNIELEKNNFHPYRTEWETAIEVASGYGRNFIFPVSEQGFDFYNSNIPEPLQRHNAYAYNKEMPDFSAFIDQMQQLLSNL
jgi:hypothetical protein